ncbi:MAG: hypothetical protein EHM18_00935 [Acidobacteria bacterium]|nr:MAG: hypothetical protein EHM18_00935 [Acidobacteriota bacterium]
MSRLVRFSFGLVSISWVWIGGDGAAQQGHPEAVQRGPQATSVLGAIRPGAEQELSTPMRDVVQPTGKDRVDRGMVSS